MLQASRLRGLQPGRSTFMTLRAKRRGPRRSHPGWWKAAYPQRRFRRLARAGRRADPGKLEAALAPRRAPVEAAQEACDRALAAAEDSVDLPRNGSAFLILDEQGAAEDGTLTDRARRRLAAGHGRGGRGPAGGRHLDTRRVATPPGRRPPTRCGRSSTPARRLDRHKGTTAPKARPVSVARLSRRKQQLSDRGRTGRRAILRQTPCLL
jgi:hypothetical protein